LSGGFAGAYPALEAQMASRSTADTPETPAPLVFTGHVVQRNAATLPDIASKNTAIVAVDHVVAVPPMFVGLTGTEITVRFGPIRVPPLGSSRTFHATGWIYGPSIAVDAVSVEPARPEAVAAATRRSAQSTAKDSALVGRMDTADLGVVGEVTAVHPVEVPTTRISEHDPVWHQATIKVDEVVKGQPDTTEVNVVFPLSDDVRWRGSPKYHAGQQGIWLLHRGDVPESHGPATRAAAADVGDVLTALNPTDFLPLEELGRVKALLDQ
jgi:hypothetical protein